MIRWSGAMVVALIFLSSSLSAQEYKNYELEIDGRKYEMNMGESIRAKTSSGQSIHVRLNKKAYAEFNDGVIAFQHASNLTVASHDLGSGVTQHMSASATGGLILIQVYEDTGSVNADQLVNIMMGEVSEEGVALGGKFEKQASSRTLISGERMKGQKAKLKQGDDEMFWEIVAIKRANGLILVMTQVSRDFMREDEEMQKRLWKTLRILR